MEKINQIVSEKIEKASELFNQKNELYKHIFIKDIDCSLLPETNTDGKELPEEIKRNIFSHLHQFDQTEIEVNKCPAVYIFELCNEQDRERVIKAFEKVKDQKEINRSFPALRNKIPQSKYLYVGKVEREVGGRIVTHLGYYQSNYNHGLQLAYWAKELNPPLKLNLHVLRFKEDFRDYIAAMEVIMAKELQPIIGKH